MGMAQLVVAAVVVERRSNSEVARHYGVSRRWVITLVQRYLAEGEAGLEPRSRRPLRSPRRTPVEVQDEIVKIRKELDRAGTRPARRPSRSTSSSGTGPRSRPANATATPPPGTATRIWPGCWARPP
jgi:transposase-like protein